MFFHLHAAIAQSAERVIIVRSGIENGKISDQWRDALVSRMSASKLDSMSQLKRSLTDHESGWVSLIRSKAARWNLYRDSLLAPFGYVSLPDTVYVLVGAFGVDDGFTYQYNVVCFDVSALFQNYGPANAHENDNRIDRLFSHEFTHLIHKSWAIQNRLELHTFSDSVLWECLYEGIGMYRSLSPKWFPENGVLPEEAARIIQDLYPQFVLHIGSALTVKNPSLSERLTITRNLSRGPVTKKWGALPVALWLALEARGTDSNLTRWLNAGPISVLRLADKYLAGEDRQKLQVSIRQSQRN